MTIQENINRSADDFLHVVWPIIKEHLGGGQIIPVEIVTDIEFSKEIDMLAGIDAWHVLDNNLGMRGLASRVQWKYIDGRIANGFGKTGYHTFTIRWATASGQKTEIDKRFYAIMSEPGEVLFPAYTVQAYLDKPKGAYLSGAIIKTRELILRAIEYQHLFPAIQVNGGNIMRAFDWKWLSTVTESLKVIPAPIHYDGGYLFDVSELR